MTDLAHDDQCEPGAVLIPIERDEAEQIARVLKALSDPTRLQLLSMISTSPDGRACVCDLTAPLGLTQPTVSHHLKTLADAGLLTRDKRGSWAWYAIAADRAAAVKAFLPDLHEVLEAPSTIT